MFSPPEIHPPVSQIEESDFFAELDARIEEEADAEAEWHLYQEEPDEPVDPDEHFAHSPEDHIEDLDRLDDLPPLSW